MSRRGSDDEPEKSDLIEGEGKGHVDAEHTRDEAMKPLEDHVDLTGSEVDLTFSPLPDIAALLPTMNGMDFDNPYIMNEAKSSPIPSSSRSFSPLPDISTLFPQEPRETDLDPPRNPVLSASDVEERKDSHPWPPRGGSHSPSALLPRPRKRVRRSTPDAESFSQDVDNDADPLVQFLGEMDTEEAPSVIPDLGAVEPDDLTSEFKDLWKLLDFAAEEESEEPMSAREALDLAAEATRGAVLSLLRTTAILAQEDNLMNSELDYLSRVVRSLDRRYARPPFRTR